MLTIIRGLRVLVGLVGVWQAIGLLPVFTNWLPNLQYVTGGMWGLAVVKVSIMLFCGGIYYWLGTVKKRIAETGAGSSDGRIIIFSMGVLCNTENDCMGHGAWRMVYYSAGVGT